MTDPIDPKYRESMNILAGFIDDYLNGPDCPTDKKEVGFFLTIFPFKEEGRFNYISNADKLDVRAMLKEITARIEGRLMKEEKEKRQ